MNHTAHTTQVLSSLYIALSSDTALRPTLGMKLMKLVKLLVVKTKSYLLIHPSDFFSLTLLKCESSDGSPHAIRE